MKVVSKMTYAPKVEHQENGPWKSQTLPDETMTIRQIYERFAQGQELNVGRTVTGYKDEPDFDSLDLEGLQRMERVEQDEIVADLVDQKLQDEFRSKKKARIAQKKKDAAEAAERAKFDQWKLSQKDPK